MNEEPHPQTSEIRSFTLSFQSPITEAMLLELENLLEFVPASRLSKSLRNMFLLYLTMEQYPNDFKQQTEDLYFLFSFLDALEESEGH